MKSSVRIILDITNFLATGAALGIIGFVFVDYIKLKEGDFLHELIYFGFVLLVVSNFMLATKKSSHPPAPIIYVLPGPQNMLDNKIGSGSIRVDSN